ncbi:MAG TPA: M15 family metallopeptidase [Mycobacteriales bacterium]|jgi:zinc D-Ala-D-Ala carboxypeptidase|nr:M15 family metallopeptidase [Mycobacteriales bacterium]
MSITRLIRMLAAVAVGLASFAAVSIATAPPAAADGCYTWSGTLREGSSGDAVTRLQIRVAGWVAYGEVLGIDGQFGPATKRAVIRFQQAYGLTADGIAGSQTFNKIYELQDDDCTPIHFTFAEVTYNCGRGGFSGGAVSATQVRENLLRAMWKAEALRHKLGDRPIGVSSGFRDYSCNASVGGASNSRHLYGDALDLVPGPSLCSMAQTARSTGFNGIFGPGYPNHNDHTHVDSGPNRSWSAPNCGI